MHEQIHASACPVLDLPNEIVSEIFLNVLPVYPHRPSPTGPSSPTVLAQICSRWRQLSFSTPLLWRAIRLKFRDCTESAPYLTILQTWLTRSNNRPLSISLEYDAFEAAGSLNPSVLARFLDEIVPHSARWEYIELMVPLALVPLIQGPMPLLRALTFGPSYFSREISSIFEPAPIPAFDEAPNLDTLILSRYFAPSSVILPWAQITTLTAQSLHFHECLEIMHHAANLVHCTFTLRYDDFEESVTHLAVPPLRRLESLTLLDNDLADDSQQKLLDELTLPALHRLQISERWFRQDPRATLGSLISRACCAPTELIVTEAALEYRSAFPAIAILAVHNARESPAHTLHMPVMSQPRIVQERRKVQWGVEPASIEFWDLFIKLLHLLFKWSGAFVSLMDRK